MTNYGFCTQYLTLALLWLMLPVTMATAQDVEIDRQLGARSAKAVAVQMGLYDDPGLTAYVAKVGNRLVAELEDNPFAFKFFVADEATPNAFALPGGYVYVTRGLLALINTEDELATIMGHEIIHAYRRHSVKQARKSILPRLLELPGNLVGVLVNDNLGNLLNAPIKAGNELFLSSYSRKHEKESDKMGIALAAKAGYNPKALGPVLTRLSTAGEALTGNAETRSYFADHPYTPDRVEKINKELTKITWTETAKVSNRFPAELDGLLFGNNPDKGVFIENTFLHPGLQLGLSFPKGWQTANEVSTVGAAPEDGKAAILLNLIDEDRPPKQVADEFAQNWYRQNRQKPTLAGAYTINGNPGYHLAYILNSQEGKSSLDIIWFRMKGMYYRLLGLTPEAETDEFDRTAKSLHTLSAEEIAGIPVYKIKVVRAKDNESLPALSGRAQNILRLNLTAIMNDVEAKGNLPGGQRVKVVVEEKYRH